MPPKIDNTMNELVKNLWIAALFDALNSYFNDSTSWDSVQEILKQALKTEHKEAGDSTDNDAVEQFWLSVGVFIGEVIKTKAQPQVFDISGELNIIFDTFHELSAKYDEKFVESWARIMFDFLGHLMAQNDIDDHGKMNFLLNWLPVKSNSVWEKLPLKILLLKVYQLLAELAMDQDAQQYLENAGLLKNFIASRIKIVSEPLKVRFYLTAAAYVYDQLIFAGLYPHYFAEDCLSQKVAECLGYANEANFLDPYLLRFLHRVNALSRQEGSSVRSPLNLCEGVVSYQSTATQDGESLVENQLWTNHFNLLRLRISLISEQVSLSDFHRGIKCVDTLKQKIALLAGEELSIYHLKEVELLIAFVELFFFVLKGASGQVLVEKFDAFFGKTGEVLKNIKEKTDQQIYSNVSAWMHAIFYFFTYLLQDKYSLSKEFLLDLLTLLSSFSNFSSAKELENNRMLFDRAANLLKIKVNEVNEEKREEVTEKNRQCFSVLRSKIFSYVHKRDGRVAIRLVNPARFSADQAVYHVNADNFLERWNECLKSVSLVRKAGGGFSCFFPEDALLKVEVLEKQLNHFLRAMLDTCPEYQKEMSKNIFDRFNDYVCVKLLDDSVELTLLIHKCEEDVREFPTLHINGVEGFLHKFNEITEEYGITLCLFDHEDRSAGFKINFSSLQLPLDAAGLAEKLFDKLFAMSVECKRLTKKFVFEGFVDEFLTQGLIQGEKIPDTVFFELGQNVIQPYWDNEWVTCPKKITLSRKDFLRWIDKNFSQYFSVEEAQIVVLDSVENFCLNEKEKAKAIGNLYVCSQEKNNAKRERNKAVTRWLKKYLLDTTDQINIETVIFTAGGLFDVIQGCFVDLRLASIHLSREYFLLKLNVLGESFGFSVDESFSVRVNDSSKFNPDVFEIDSGEYKNFLKQCFLLSDEYRERKEKDNAKKALADQNRRLIERQKIVSSNSSWYYNYLNNRIAKLPLLCGQDNDGDFYVALDNMRLINFMSQLFSVSLENLSIEQSFQLKSALNQLKLSRKFFNAIPPELRDVIFFDEVSGKLIVAEEYFSNEDIKNHSLFNGIFQVKLFSKKLKNLLLANKAIKHLLDEVAVSLDGVQRKDHCDTRDPGVTVSSDENSASEASVLNSPTALFPPEAKTDSSLDPTVSAFVPSF